MARDVMMGTKDKRQTEAKPTFISVKDVPSLKMRACQLTWPGERSILIDDLPQARVEGWQPVALVWHGEHGSRREPWKGK